MRDLPVSTKRQKLLDKVNNTPLKINDIILVQDGVLGRNLKEKRKFGENCIITDINCDKITVKRLDSSVHKSFYSISEEDILSRNVRNVGVNPFNEKFESIRPVAFTLDSILFNLNILGERNIGNVGRVELNGIPVKELNWNPFVFDKEGNKMHYQRDFVWTIEDNQLLIESIYQGIECGRILIRKRGWSTVENMGNIGENELAFADIVDGKQRLNAVRGFIMQEYPDFNGNYFGDLSYNAQHKLTNHQLFSFAEMPEDTTDEEVLYQFLKLNHTGIPQSKEHIEHVKELLKTVNINKEKINETK